MFNRRKGTFTVDDIENSDGPQDVMASGAVNFQVMNIAILGGIKMWKHSLLKWKDLKIQAIEPMPMIRLL